MFRTGVLHPQTDAIQVFCRRNGYPLLQSLVHFLHSQKQSKPISLKIGILGTGGGSLSLSICSLCAVARTLSSGLLRHGHFVALGSREPSNAEAQKWMNEHKHTNRASVVTLEEAAKFGVVFFI